MATSARERNASSSAVVKFDGGDEDEVRVLAGVAVERGEDGVGGAVHIGRLADSEAGAAGDRHRLDLVEQHDRRRAVVGQDGMCSPSSSMTRCWVWPCSALISPCGLISISRTAAADQRARAPARGRAPGWSCRCRAARKQDQPVQRSRVEGQVTAQAQGQQGLVAVAGPSSRRRRRSTPRSRQVGVGQHLVLGDPLAYVHFGLLAGAPRGLYGWPYACNINATRA